MRASVFETAGDDQGAFTFQGIASAITIGKSFQFCLVHCILRMLCLE